MHVARKVILNKKTSAGAPNVTQLWLHSINYGDLTTSWLTRGSGTVPADAVKAIAWADVQAEGNSITWYCRIVYNGVERAANSGNGFQPTPIKCQWAGDGAGVAATLAAQFKISSELWDSSSASGGWYVT